jgi:3-oxoadipate enol-lactonase
MFDQGTGPPLIVIPGIQGRWEWLRPALRELRKHRRTVSYTLSGDIGSGSRFDPALGFDNYVRQLDSVFVKTGIQSAALCGVSYGGFIALRYAAVRPGRITALILASSPAPGWVPNERQQAYVARPLFSLPRFVAAAPMRIWPEVRAACDTWGERLAFIALYAARVIAAPMIPWRMATRVRLQQGIDFAPDCAGVRAPTLVITGDDALDQVVPAAVSRMYLDLIPGAQYEKMERTGHLGIITRPKQFADVVNRFLESNSDPN